MHELWHCLILRQNRGKFFLAGLTKSFRPCNAVPAFQRFQIAWLRPSKSKFFCAAKLFNWKFVAEEFAENAIKTRNFFKNLSNGAIIIEKACFSCFAFKTTNFAKILKQIAWMCVLTSSAFRSSAAVLWEEILLHCTIKQRRTWAIIIRKKIRKNGFLFKFLLNLAKF